MIRYIVLYVGPVSGKERKFPEMFRTLADAESTSDRLIEQGFAKECKIVKKIS